MIWFAMAIPLFALAIKLLFFHQKMKWWEFGVPFIVSALLCGGFKVMAEYGATRDSEIWGGWAVSAHHYEDWNQYIRQMCPVTSCSGAGKAQSCTTTMVDCSYVQYYPEYWAIKDSNGAKHGISQNSYRYFINLFEMQPRFVDMRRPYHTNDGDMYQVLWPRTPETVEPVTTLHTYENRVQAARSVFSYVPVSREDAQSKGLFEYPKMQLFNYPTVLGDCGPNTKAANDRLRYYNAVLGAKKQLRIWFMCFNSSDPQVGELQEAYWVGGNKNEVVVTVGTNEDGSLNWVHPFSWTDHKGPLIEIRDFIAQQPQFDPVAAAEFIGPRLEEGFVRKHFADFSYLTVEPPLWSVIVTYVVTLLVNLGLSWWLINNEFHEGKYGHSHPFERMRRRRCY